MDLWNIPHDAIRAAASRKCGLPLWRIGSVSVTTGLWATVRVIAGPVVTVHGHDVRLEDVSNGTGATATKGAP